VAPFFLKGGKMKKVFLVAAALSAAIISSSAVMADETTKTDFDAGLPARLGAEICPSLPRYRQPECFGEALRIHLEVLEILDGISGIYVAGLADGDVKAAEKIAADLKGRVGVLEKDLVSFLEE